MQFDVANASHSESTSGAAANRRRTRCIPFSCAGNERTMRTEREKYEKHHSVVSEMSSFRELRIRNPVRHIPIAICKLITFSRFPRFLLLSASQRKTMFFTSFEQTDDKLHTKSDQFPLIPAGTVRWNGFGSKLSLKYIFEKKLNDRIHQQIRKWL